MKNKTYWDFIKIILQKSNLSFHSIAATLFFVALTGCGGGQSSEKLQSEQAPEQLKVQPSSIAISSPAGAPISTPNPPPRVGMNLNALSYWDRSFSMADLGRQAKIRGLDWSDKLIPDSNGYPQQDFILIYSATNIKSGIYKLSFNGRANISAGGSGTIQNKIYDPTTNITKADVALPTDAVGNVWLTFTNTYRNFDSARGDGLTNVHLWRPGYPADGTALFTSEFLEAMKRFKVLRTMEMVSINTNPHTTWNQRTKPNFFGMTEKNGQSWELLTALANATNRDIWLNVPVNADNDYILKLAQLIKFGSDGNLPYTSPQKNPIYPPLKPGLSVYIEYGNELWNHIFPGHHSALALANFYKGDITHPIAFDGAQTDEYVALRRWIAYRSAFTSLTFREVFGDSAMMTTIRPILAAQVGNANAYLSNGLRWAQSFYGQVRNTAPVNRTARNLSDIWYGGGGAAYYDAAVTPTDSSQATMETYFSTLPTPNFAKDSIKDSIWTHGYGLKYVAYEGGPGPGGSGSSPNWSISPAYNNDPRMKDRVVLAQNIWDQAGGDELMYYVYSGSSPWSFSNDLTQQTFSDNGSFKLQAIDQINSMPKANVTLGSSVPGTIYLKDPASQTIGSDGAPWALNGTVYLLRLNVTNPPPYILVPIKTTTNGTYKISLDVPNIVTGSVQLYVNGTSYGPINLTPNTSGTATLSAKVAVRLSAGLSVLRIEAPTGSRDILVKNVIVE